MNSRIPRLLFVFMLSGCVFFSQWAFAQAPAAEQPAKPAAEQAASPASPAEQKPTLPSPTDKDLAFLLGKWDTKIKIAPNDLLGNKEEFKGAGKAEYKVFGKVIEGILTSDTDSGQYEDREFIWHDDGTNDYNIIRISPEGYASNRKMTKSGEHFVVEYSGTKMMDGKKPINFTVRAKFKIISDTEVKYSSEVKIGKADFVPFVQLKMQRVSK